MFQSNGQVSRFGMYSFMFLLVSLGACVMIDPIGEPNPSPKTLSVALVQFDSIAEKTSHNLKQMERLTREAVQNGARLVMFHEGCLTDYTPRLEELAEPVPGPTTKKMTALARELNCMISFGLSEREDSRFYITQAFIDPAGLIYRYRKSWLWRDASDKGYRNEWARYDPGTGPELFKINGIKATCFICADGEAPRCIERAKELKPELVFYSNNRVQLPDHTDMGARAAIIGAPLLVTNRIGEKLAA